MSFHMDPSGRVVGSSKQPCLDSEKHPMATLPNEPFLGGQSRFVLDALELFLFARICCGRSFRCNESCLMLSSSPINLCCFQFLCEF